MLQAVLDLMHRSIERPRRDVVYAVVVVVVIVVVGADGSVDVGNGPTNALL